MGFIQETWSRMTAAVKAFREPYLVSRFDQEDFGDFDARQLRYAIYWSFYENTAYRNVHKWGRKYKIDYGLYRYIRGIYNPTYRLGEFWKTHLWGGPLDPMAGDGQQEATALPIAIPAENADADALRLSLALLWKWSNWQTRKDIVSLTGAVLGDVALQVVDDTERGRVYLDVVHPTVIRDVTLDAYGNVKGYVFQEERRNPANRGQMVTYSEICSRDGDMVVYQTLMNQRPYPWNGEAAEWSEPYGFVPLVMIQHNNVGADWGWSEVHPGRGKFQEADDIASKLDDQIRKVVDSPWFLAGVSKPKSTRTATSLDDEAYQETDAALDRPTPGQEEVPMIYTPNAQASAKSMVGDLDIGAVNEVVGSLLKEIERDYPEVQMDIWTAGGDTSGRALRVARQRAESKVVQRRPNYDDALVRAQQMAVAIGGWRGYEGFAPFNLDSYQAGRLTHGIGKRGVFAADPLDDEEQEDAFWTAAQKAIKSGVPLLAYLRRRGWTDEQIALIESEPEYQQRRQMMALMGESQDG